MKLKNKSKSLSITVGITTCYGDISILDTVKSIRNSKGVDKFNFIIIADRTSINKEIKAGLKKYGVKLIENKKEAGQVEKQRQILAMTKTDLLLLTQDDVLFHPYTLKRVLSRFQSQKDTTMISISYLPVKASNLFEDVINSGTYIVNKIVKSWNRGDNYLASVGRFMAFRTNFIKKFRMPPIAVSDNYYYFENKKMGGKFEFLHNAIVYFKNPQNMKEHLRKSSRFQHSAKEMDHYFEGLSKEYKVPKNIVLKAVVQQIFENPTKTIPYIAIYAYTRLLTMKPKEVLNPIWEIDLSTKKIV